MTDINNENPNIVSNFELFQNYPNPFNPVTVIEYSLPTGQVGLSVNSMQSSVGSLPVRQVTNNLILNQPINQSPNQTLNCFLSN